MPAVLIEDLLEQVLLRIPPDDPASLARCALVSKRWRRLICGRAFRRRFREFHGKPPLLGIMCHPDRTAPGRFFVPTSSFKPRLHGGLSNMNALSSCHGRVLLHSADDQEDLFVWDPLTGKLQKLPRRPRRLLYDHIDYYSAVLCAPLGGGCDHRDDGDLFMVVLAVVDDDYETFVGVYSSEDDTWSEPIYAGEPYCYIHKGNSVVIGSAAYFMCFSKSTVLPEILKYDLQTKEICSIHIPIVGNLEHINRANMVLMALEDGRLGFVGIQNWSAVSLWSRMEHGSDEAAGWAQSRVIELDTLLHEEIKWTCVVGFADTGGGGVILLWSYGRLFSLDLKSGSSKVVGEGFGRGHVVPYVSFCTPALRAVSMDEGPGVGETASA